MSCGRSESHGNRLDVLKHYLRPGREDFRQVLVRAMPKMLGTGDKRSALERAREILERMTAKTCIAERDRILAILTAG